MVQLVLWDIDHTLVETRGIGRELFGRAFNEVTGLEMTRQAAIDGMTDAVIFRETAELHNLKTDREDFERFAVALAEQHLCHAPAIRERGHALAGAAAALSRVAALTDVTQTVVTGNIQGSAKIKLGVFGLDPQIDWSIGAYGEDDDERTQLVRIALERAAQALGKPVRPSETVLIGDTPSDVKAGKANDVRVIAVASGRSDANVLRAAGAETVIDSLQNTSELLELIVGTA